MASSSRSRTRTRTRKQYRKGNKACGGGGGSSKRRSRSRTDKKRKTHKWSQKGCQSGGSNLVGTGSAWHPSGMEHQTAGSASAYATNSGNHFALNTNTLAPPQSSNHLVEKGMFGGRRSRRHFAHSRRAASNPPRWDWPSRHRPRPPGPGPPSTLQGGGTWPSHGASRLGRRQSPGRGPKGSSPQQYPPHCDTAPPG